MLQDSLLQKTRRLQSRLSKRVIKEDMLPKTLRYVVGIDVSYVDEWSIGAAAVLSYSALSLQETQTVRVKTRFPYIPTLLSLRETKPAKAAVRKLKTPSDVFLVDGHGIAHPYRLGFASHLGIILDKPTIGTAKSLLIGQVGPLNQARWAPITDKGEVLGAAIKKDENHKPIYVSIGHKVSLERAIEIVKHCMKSARVPEPIRRAHIVANQEKRKYKRKML